MRAVVVEETGGSDKLLVRDLDTPRPGPDEVLVDVAAAGVNFIDTYQREGLYPKDLPFVVGSEGAGTVAEVGSGVTDVSVGDRVAWAQVDGRGYAEQVALPAERAVPVPDDMDLELAAAVMLQGMTAHYLCESTFPAQSGQTALVHAGAGGVGLLLTQMLAAKGVRVLTTTSTEEKAELSRGAGAAEVIRYTEVDLVPEVRRLTDGRGVDVVYDGVGKTTFDAGLDCLVTRGMMVLFGASSGPVPPLDPQVLNRKGSLFLTRPTLTHYIVGREELLMRAESVLGQVASGALDVRVGGRYPLDDARRAHDDLEGRRTTGKLLVIP
ncbi:MAG TPA: quinone oxidoreductase [Nocardioidaceae bacterium]|nr:quinone oxidoreductase [Nocardioidaceae bacterium]